MVTQAEQEKALSDLSKKTYQDQAQWFLNVFWQNEDPNTISLADKPEEAENIWKWCKSCEDLDQRGSTGNELDEFEAHKFLEKEMGALTMRDMREALREIDVDFNKMVSLTEFLIYHFKVDWKLLTSAKSALDPVSAKMLDDAKVKLEESQKALTDSTQAAADAKVAAETAAEEAKEAIAREAESKEAAAAAVEEEAAAAEVEEAAVAGEKIASEKEAVLTAANAEQEKALKALEEETRKLEDKKQKLRDQIEDDSVGLVKTRNCQATLAQVECEDPLPLNRAKITQAAAVRKVGKALKPAQEAAAVATAAREKANAARAVAVEKRNAANQASEDATKARQAADESAAASVTAGEAAEAAVNAADQAVTEAAEALEEAKRNCKGLSNQGTLWWMDRDFEESKKYMSKKMIAKLEAQRAAQQTENAEQ